MYVYIYSFYHQLAYRYDCWSVKSNLNHLYFSKKLKDMNYLLKIINKTWPTLMYIHTYTCICVYISVYLGTCGLQHFVLHNFDIRQLCGSCTRTAINFCTTIHHKNNIHTSLSTLPGHSFLHPKKNPLARATYCKFSW